ncbi:hypothetical protein [uncultured Enterococcus sp.]|uniref:hypothetical protein n=1 Tax=uncultured Enterococcus sp. TaxID=167972 RepID=UPI002AA6A4FC|nr:hypothetical protein [uncultured Enterococcus sp.]
MKKIFQCWVQTAAFIPDYIDNLSALNCPSCGCSTLDYLYGGDRETRVGYGLFWCTTCKRGVHISRLYIPAVVSENKVIYFDDPHGSEKQAQLVPEFKRMTP